VTWARAGVTAGARSVIYRELVEPTDGLVQPEAAKDGSRDLTPGASRTLAPPPGVDQREA